MDGIHYLIVVFLVAYIGVRIAVWWGNRWKKRARYAYMVIGQHGQSAEECEWGYRNALLAGESKALLFYLCSAMEKFMEDKPLTPMPFDDGMGGTIPFVFYDYYLPMKIRNFGTDKQKELSWVVNEFKEGRVDASGYFLTAIAKLGLSGTLTILFMPCSKERNYYIRFRMLAKEFGRYKELEPELYSMTYISERKSKHRSMDRKAISAASNIAVDANVVGKQNCVLVDDVCTTGDSIRTHIAELRNYGVRVVGVVCLGRTARIPTKEQIMKQAEKDSELNLY
ncbi:MAG: phosphoribosyltransferase [Prevotella sp.]